MNKLIFLLPMYNDWDSLKMVLKQINSKLEEMQQKGCVIVVNDYSIERNKSFDKYLNIEKISVLNLKENVGSQKAISIGLKYISSKYKEKDIITVLDSDGEDDVSQIPSMVKLAKENFDRVIVSCRTKREEKLIFKFLYFCHKLITLFFTLKWISFGNFSSFYSENTNDILKNDKSWLAFSGCLSYNCKILRLRAPRKTRLIGNSKLSLKGLINHALRINGVFIKRLSFIFLLYIIIFYLFIDTAISFYLIIAISLFYIGVIYSYFSNDQKRYYNSSNLIRSIDQY